MKEDILNKNEITERDSYLDIARGICSISIIFIHTVFWSGEGYTPKILQGIALLIDVPLFFFIAGCTRSLTKGDLVISAILRFILSFSTTALLYSLFTFKLDVGNLSNALTLNYPDYEKIPLMKGSFWFVPTYCVVSIFAAILLRLSRVVTYTLFALCALYYIATFTNTTSISTMQVLGANANFVLFYLTIYMCGYLFHAQRFPIDKMRKIGAIIIGLSLSCFAALSFIDPSIKISNLQIFKFPLTLPYGVASTLSIGLCILAWNPNLKYLRIQHIGKNALFYYIAQAIGGSFLLSLNPLIQLPWAAKLPIMFTINVIVTVIFAEILRVIVLQIEKLILLPKTTSRKLRS
ncbi:acyltransferase [Bdellovibrio bacteriovorus]|uniref:acyltransferase family protein n=1 Tax=Bdellovibrio bacteriovorus TaxID=959 RepID=UPI0021CE3E5F|nr:acyltransferase [Bdellovibrio bacteriovorus]UXR63784.1 acyltransferase [Bdellovibrio bacteriovorus]